MYIESLTKKTIEVHIHFDLPKFKNFGFFIFPSNTSQYGAKNAIVIKINATIVKQIAVRRFLLCAPILI